MKQTWQLWQLSLRSECHLSKFWRERKGSVLGFHVCKLAFLKWAFCYLYGCAVKLECIFISMYLTFPFVYIFMWKWDFANHSWALWLLDMETFYGHSVVWFVYAHPVPALGSFPALPSLDFCLFLPSLTPHRLECTHSLSHARSSGVTWSNPLLEPEFFCELW